MTIRKIGANIDWILDPDIRSRSTTPRTLLTLTVTFCNLVSFWRKSSSCHLPIYYTFGFGMVFKFLGQLLKQSNVFGNKITRFGVNG